MSKIKTDFKIIFTHVVELFRVWPRIFGAFCIVLQKFQFPYVQLKAE